MPKLGSIKNPTIVRVQSMEKAQEILTLCEERGWKAIVGIEPDKREDISDVEKLLKSSEGKKKKGRRKRAVQ